jgi:hypothetical protein
MGTYVRKFIAMLAAVAAVVAGSVLASSLPAAAGRLANSAATLADAPGTLAAAPQPGTFVPLGRARVLDTRASHPIGAGQTLTFPVAGQAGVAAGASAVTANVTLLAPPTAGSVSVFPGGTAWTGAATISFPAGSNPQNVLTAALGTDGSLSIRNNLASALQVIVDVQGYFAGGAVSTAGGYRTISQQRPYDTRRTTSHQLAAGGTATFAVAGTGAIPAGAGSVELNLTVLAPARAGSVSLFPGDSAWNGAATASFGAGTNVQHMLAEQLGADGTLSIRNNTGVGLQVIIDVPGYYLSGTVTQTGGYTPIALDRVLDSRLDVTGQYPVASGYTAVFPAVATRLNGTGAAVPASGVSAVMVNVTVLTPSGPGSIAVLPGGSAWDGSATLSFAAGASQQSMIAAKVGVDGRLAIRNNARTAVVIVADVVGYFFGEPTPYHAGVTAPVDPAHGAAESLSCPTTTFCMAVEQAGYVLSFDGTSWTPAYRPAGFTGTLTSVSCSSASFCVAAGSAAISWDGTDWSSPLPVGNGQPMVAVSCVSASFCLAVDAAGNYATYDGSSWHSAGWAGSVLASVSCVSASFCLGADRAGRASSYDGTTWTAPVQVPGVQTLAGLSCATATFCLAVDTAGWTSIFDGSAWADPQRAAAVGSIVALSCPDASDCLALNSGGWYSSYHAGSWTLIWAPTGRLGETLLSCASATSCVAISKATDVAATVYDGTGWSGVSWADRTHGALDRVSCASASFCLAGNNSGTISRFDGTGWQPAGYLTDLGSLATIDISCVSDTFCVAVGNGDAAVYDGTSWTTSSIDPHSSMLSAVSCSSVHFCRAVDRSGNSMTFDGSSWSTPINYGGEFVDISCPDDGYCVAVSPGGYRGMVFSGNITWTANTYSPASPERVSCPSSSYCLISAYSHGSSYYGAATWAGGPWVDIPANASESLYALSCPAADRCLGLSPSGAIGYDGLGWTAPVTGIEGAVQDQADLSCPSSTFCMAVLGGDTATTITG